MSLLQPWVLFALPLVVIPVAIHLIHRRRQKVVEWGAMRFLLEGQLVSKGIQKLRHILILLMRVLAVAGLLFAIGRPLTGGLMSSIAGGGPDTVLILLDRSASMASEVRGKSRLMRSVQQLVATLENIQAKRLLVLDGSSLRIHAISKPQELLDLPQNALSSARMDMSRMLEEALASLERGDGGRSEVWICSDLQSSDWEIENEAWGRVRRRLQERAGTVSVRVICVNEATPQNLAIEVLNTRFRKQGNRGELLVDLRVSRDSPVEEVISVPVSFAFGETRTTLDLDLMGRSTDHKAIRIPIDLEDTRGYGRVEIPADSNLMDNVSFATFAPARVPETLVVAEDDEVRGVMSLAARVPMGDGLAMKTVSVRPEEFGSLDLSNTGLVIWQGQLPGDGEVALLEEFVRDGGRIIFLPSKSEALSATEAFGFKWGAWRELQGDETSPTVWRDDADLVANGGDGRSLALGALSFTSVRDASGEGVVLAQLGKGTPLLTRCVTSAGGAYVLRSLPIAGGSNLASQGIALLGIVKRAAEEGAKARMSDEQWTAGFPLGSGTWKQLDCIVEPSLSTERHLYAGIVTNGEELLAINRPRSEQLSPLLSPEVINDALPGVAVLVGDKESDGKPLLDEVWTLFMTLVLVFLFVEALLSLERRQPGVPA